jgi:hypothetical protein
MFIDTVVRDDPNYRLAKEPVSEQTQRSFLGLADFLLTRGTKLLTVQLQQQVNDALQE